MSIKVRAMLICAILLAGCQQPVPVTTTAPERRALQQSFSEQAEIRLTQTFPVTMPATGTIGRVTMEPGDRVRKGQRLAVFDRLPQVQLVAESVAQVQEIESQLALNRHSGVEDTQQGAAQAQLSAVLQEVESAHILVAESKARLDQAKVDQQRMEGLHSKGFATGKERDDAVLFRKVSENVWQRAQRQLYAAQSNLVAAQQRLGTARETLQDKALRQRVLESQLSQALARLTRVKHDARQAELLSPIDGLVLERYQLGPGPLLAGERILLLGRRSDMEAVCEVLTQDAVHLRPGTPVTMTAAPGAAPISGKVRRIEPQAFTKLSALGVEQKRVRVIIALDRVPSEVGVGYRLEACFVTTRKPAALTVPRFAVIQAPDRSFYVFVVLEGRLKRQTVKLGLQEDAYLEVVAGLSEKDQVVTSPDASYQEGVQVGF